VRHLGPGQAFVDAGFARETQDPFAEDVPHDLRRPAFDGIGPGPEERLSDVTSDAAGPFRSLHFIVGGIEGARHPQEIDAELIDVLVELGAD
jgi:hypothetical protein